MNPMLTTGNPGADAGGALAGAMLTGGLVTLGMTLGLFALGVLIWYLVIKAAVRDGIIQAYKKMGIDSPGGGGLINGYPPAQVQVGPPPAPGYQGYRGPNG